jgi:hypothetical protein
VSAAGIILAATCAATVVSAADVDFRPAMTLGVFSNGNVSVIGPGQGDDGASLELDLDVDRKTPKSVFAFSYRPSYVAYRRSSDLDYFGNTIILSFARESSLTSRFNLDAYASRTDNQSQIAETADRATTFVPRTTLTRGNMRVGGTVGAGQRGFVDWQLRAGGDRYKDLKDDPGTVVDESFDFNNSENVGGRLAWRRELSVRNSLGLGLDVARFWYEITPAVDVESIGLVGTCQAGPSWILDYSAGASRATSDGESIDGVSFEAKLAHEVKEASTFSAGLRQAFAPGTGLTGSTRDRGVWVAYARTPTTRGLSGSVVGGYWQRDEIRFASAGRNQDTAAFTVNGLIGWKFSRFIALDLAYLFVDQSARNGSDPALDTRYSSYGIYLRWTIRGRSVGDKG